MNDLRLRGDVAEAIKYAREFGFAADAVEQCMTGNARHYTADERATILEVTYAERMQLGLRRTGSIDVDKAGRERARRDRYNAKRRAARAGARCLGVNRSSRVEERPEEKKERGEVITTEVVELQETITTKAFMPLRPSAISNLRNVSDASRVRRHHGRVCHHHRSPRAAPPVHAPAHGCWQHVGQDPSRERREPPARLARRAYRVREQQKHADRAGHQGCLSNNGREPWLVWKGCHNVSRGHG